MKPLSVLICVLSVSFAVTASRTGDALTGGVTTTEETGGSPAPARGFVNLVPMQGWPQHINTHPNYKPSGLTLVDLNGDGKLEVIAGSTDNTLNVWDCKGNMMAGWPKTLPGMIQSKAAVGDLTGDGTPEIVVSARNGYVYVYEPDGSAATGWPQNANGVIGFVSPTLFDVDGDDTLEVIMVQMQSGQPGHVYVWNHDGTVMPGWPQNMDYLGVATASAGDVDGDGTIEICAPSYRSLYLWDSKGDSEPGWPVHIGDGASYAQAELYDLDNDGKLEIGFASCPNSRAQVLMFRYDGTNQPGWPNYITPAQPYVCPVGGAMNEDTTDISIFSGGHQIGGIGFYGWFSNGSTMPGWPVAPDFLECSPVVFDMDGRVVMIASNTTPGELYAYDVEGTLVEGFPFSTPGAALPNSPSIADVDDDDTVEIGLFTSDGSVSLWKVQDERWYPEYATWPTWFHDNWHTGWLHPQAVTGLLAERGNPGVRLTWNKNPEPDLAGYFVYRIGVSGKFEKLYSGPWPDTTFHDTTATGDTNWGFRVTAAIKAGNEGFPSQSVMFNPMGLEETPSAEVRTTKSLPTLVRGMLFLPRSENGDCPASNSMRCSEGLSPVFAQPALLNAVGRKVMSLLPGPNDVSSLAPGVYFVTVHGSRSTVHVRKVVVQR